MRCDDIIRRKSIFFKNFSKKAGFAVTIGTLCAAMTVNVGAAGVSYLPGVTKEMSDPAYWSQSKEILMTYEEIQKQNDLTVSQKGTNMYDLKNQPDTVDGVSLNKALLSSAENDVAYYLGWTYIDKDTYATKEDFKEYIENTQNPNAKTDQKTVYAIATKRCELRAFPTEKPIRDDYADKDFDYQYLSSIRVNEPLVITSISKDGKYYLAKNICCSGWVPVEDVAVCKDKEQWLSAWDIDKDKALIVYGDKVYTEISNMQSDTSNLMLTMGTVLEQADITDPNVLIDNRAAYQNYVVWVPVRTEDGGYSKKLTLISEHNKVSDGYMPLTEENIAKVAFSALGNTYGWGGSLLSDDCSGYIRNIYKCFGLELARNTVWQSSMPMAKLDMQYMCKEEREAVLNSLPIGSILYFNGHEMMYLGKENQNYFVISSISTIMQPENPSVRQRIRGTVINNLDIKRANGKSWADDLILALVPYQTADSSEILDYVWYHDGVAFCLKNDVMQGDDKGYFNPDDNITFAEVIQILYNKEEKNKEDNKESTISDNTDKETEDINETANWYDKALTWAKEAEIIPPNTDDLLKNPETEITREQLASVLYLYGKSKGIDTDKNTDISFYSDIDEVSEQNMSAVGFVIGTGLITGKSQDTINPKDSTTRAETAVIVQRLSALADE